VDLGSVGPREVGGVKIPKASGSGFKGVFVPWVSPSDVEGEGVELGAGGRGG
jgi:hypothetical protein